MNPYRGLSPRRRVGYNMPYGSRWSRMQLKRECAIADRVTGYRDSVFMFRRYCEVEGRKPVHELYGAWVP